MPFFSIVIPVRDRWRCLTECLGSIARACISSDYEILVIDDGSREKTPPEIKDFAESLKIKFIRQVPLGISAAKNRGIAEAQGNVILFIDSDCRLDHYCLRNLQKALKSYPDDGAFQLRIIGNRRTRAGIVENLRVRAVQESLLAKNGYIKYVATGAFAIRRSSIDQAELFDVGVIRGEDSLILLKLATIGKMPRYVPEAIAKHCPPDSLGKYIVKHFWIGYHTGPARQQLCKKGGILMTTTQRGLVFGGLREISATCPTPPLYLCLVIFAYVLELFGRFAYRLFGIRPGRIKVLSTFVDPVTEQEVIARIVSSAEQRKGLFVTYLTAWTLVQCETDPKFRQLLAFSDLCYTDGAGVVFALLCTKLRRIKKVTANDFFPSLFEEISNRRLKIALVGGEKGVAETAASQIKEWATFADICMCASGYFSYEEEKHIIDKLLQTNPHIVFLGMGQPMQEQYAYRWRKVLPTTVFYCVGGLLDVITGKVISAPGWVRHCGTEWLWRLIHSPKRLWRRYLLGLPLLGLYILRHIFLRSPQKRRTTSHKSKTKIHINVLTNPKV